jgi:DNA ligase-1
MHKDQVRRNVNDQISKEMDVWFEPCMVWEIKGADIQISPIYTAAVGMADEYKVRALFF